MKNKIYFRRISSNKLSELQKNPYTRKLVNDTISKYVSEGIDDLTDKRDKGEAKEMPEVNLIAKAVALLQHNNSVLKDMKSEDAVNLIAKQAQNVQEDGSVSDLQTPQAAYDSAVRNFGKELVDAAIEANPLFLLSATHSPVMLG